MQIAINTNFCTLTFKKISQNSSWNLSFKKKKKKYYQRVLAVKAILINMRRSAEEFGDF